MQKLNIKLKNTTIIFFILISFYFIFTYSEVIKEGVLYGAELSFFILLPSLFVFMCLCDFISKLNILQKLFPPVVLCFIMSCIGGYPSGAVCIKNLYEAQSISKKEAKNMMFFCVNAGPAFLIIAVGKGMLGHINAGISLLISNILAAGIILFKAQSEAPLKPKAEERKTFFAKNASILHSAFADDPQRVGQSTNHNAQITMHKSQIFSQNKHVRLSISEAFVDSVNESGSSFIMITAFTCLFCALCFVICDLGIPNIFGMLFEVTNGCAVVYKQGIVPIAFITGFGGFSVIFQVAFISRKFRPKFIYLFFSRLAHGALSALLIQPISRLFPYEIQVFSNNIPEQFSFFSANISFSVALILLCIALLFTIYFNKDKKFIDFF